nr:ribosomal protein S18-alanine N-acetyltransferase [Leucobacter exalbidus]
MQLRDARPGDLAEIWAIEAAVFGNEAWSLALMEEELAAKHRTYLVLADASDAVQGYAGLLAVGSEGDIQTIAVAPGHRGTGQGRRLIEALLERARAKGVREIFLEVRADNPVARALYTSLSFDEIGVRPHYYQPDNVDAVVMKKQLKDHS